MEHRDIDPDHVLGRYRQLGFDLGLLEDDGSVRSASPGEIMAAAEGWEGRYVNLVLRRG
jgi:hypothetical protein